MSSLVRVLNRIKTRRTSEWLTPSQALALSALQTAMRVPGTVNLCGPPGVGKTFLSWELADQMNYAYYSHLNGLVRADDICKRGVVIDNCGATRSAHREVLKALQIEDVSRAVLVTREVIQDYTSYVELNLSPGDWDAVRQNLAVDGCSWSELPQPSLWYLVNPTLRRFRC